MVVVVVVAGRIMAEGISLGRAGARNKIQRASVSSLMGRSHRKKRANPTHELWSECYRFLFIELHLHVNPTGSARKALIGYWLRGLSSIIVAGLAPPLRYQICTYLTWSISCISRIILTIRHATHSCNSLTSSFLLFLDCSLVLSPSFCQYILLFVVPHSKIAAFYLHTSVRFCPLT